MAKSHNHPGFHAIFLTLLAVLSIPISAIQIFDQNTVPKSLNAACTYALMKDITCSPVVTAIRSDTYYQQSTLEKTCKPECSASLDTYAATVTSLCGTQKWQASDTEQELVTSIVDLLRYHYSMVCLMDTGRYCNIVAAGNAAANDEPG